MAREKRLKSAPLVRAIDAPSRRRLPILLRQAWFNLNQTFRRRLAHTGVTPDQFTAMRTLAEHDPHTLTQSHLTRLIASDPNTIGALVERMESAGWIGRVRHERDGRAYRLRLLPAGRAQYERVRQIAVALQTEVLADWTERKREQFLHDLNWVADQCHAAANRKKP
ncbi:MAG TPA: MarR family transcriptional regulator [Candidatus Saccharimonadales bacterium]|jgi:DNA-binding MarR family transcriptional regulator|nr:MarR family transcriptional regulator [Candidatus Saccharimonadales bacterium]